MTITAPVGLINSGTVSSAGHTTASFTPAANRRLLVFGYTYRQSGQVTGKPVIADSAGLTWTELGSLHTSDAASVDLWMVAWLSNDTGASPASMTITITGASNIAAAAVHVMSLVTNEFDATPRQTATGEDLANGDPAFTFASAPLANSMVIGSGWHSGSGTITAPTGYSNLINYSPFSSRRYETFYDNSSAAQGPNAQSSTNPRAIIMAFEFQEAAPNGSLAVTLDDSTLAAGASVAVSGDFAATLDDTTLAAEGTVAVFGGLAVTLEGATLSGAATVAITADLSVTLDDAVASGAGVVDPLPSANGDLSVTLDDATLAAAGSVGVGGFLAATLDDAILVAGAAVAVAADFAVTLDSTTLAAGATVSVSGSFTATTEDATLSAIADITAPAVQGPPDYQISGRAHVELIKGRAAGYSLVTRSAITRMISTMATRQNVAFTLGETWTIEALLLDASGQPLDLSGATIRWKLYPVYGVGLGFEFTTSNAISIVDLPTAKVRISISPSLQTNVRPGTYRHICRAALAGGFVSDQFAGDATINRSPF